MNSTASLLLDWVSDGTNCFSNVVKATCSLASPLLPFIQLELVQAQGESTEGIHHILRQMTVNQCLQWHGGKIDG